MVAVAAVATLAWLAAYGLVLLVTRSAAPVPGPPTMDLGAEPPAVVNLLANRWTRPDEDAAEATLLDLAARGFFAIRQPSADAAHSTIHVAAGPRGDGALLPFERRVLDRVRAAAVGGAVPLTALTFRDEKQATGWRRRFDAEVVAHARRLGLSRPRIGRTTRTVLGATALVPSVAIAVAVALWIETTATAEEKGGGWASMVVTGAILMSIFGYVAGRYRGERDTPAGQAAASYWLGVRSWLAAHETFEDLPPAAVAVWGRYPAYGAALGVSPAATAAIDLGMGSKHLVWSAHGGRWHRVRVRYPRFFDRYGQPTAALVKGGLIRVGLGLAGLALARHLPGGGVAVAAVLGALLLCWGGYRLARAAVDHHTPAEIVGEVLWVSVWRTTSGGEDRPAVPWLHHLAVDDGTSDRTVAWGLPSAWAARTSPGDLVRLRARRWTRRVVSLEVLREGGGARLHRGFATTDDTHDLVRAALGERRAPAAARRSATGRAAALLTPDEVARAVGVPVRVREVGPLHALYERADDGGTVLLVQFHQGRVAKLFWPAARAGTPVVGVGDEAYVREAAGAVRKGDAFLTVALHRTGRAAAPHLPWLLGQAAARL